MAGNLKITFTEGINFGGLSGSGQVTTLFVDDIQELDETLAPNLTDSSIGFGGDVVNSVAQFLEADADMTVKTYLSTVLKDTIILKKNVPAVWNNLKPSAQKPLTLNFDEIKVTTGAVVAPVTGVRLKIGVGVVEP